VPAKTHAEAAAPQKATPRHKLTKYVTLIVVIIIGISGKKNAKLMDVGGFQTLIVTNAKMAAL
jgi:hypothetical protein